MKKILLGATAAALLMTGCAQNELLDGGISTPNDGKIRFAGTTGLVTTKAAPGNPFNSTADLQKHGLFNVKGYVEGTTTPLVNTAVKFNGVSWEYWDGTKYSNDEPYWPNSAMDFFAYANWGTAPNVTSNGMTATGVTIGADHLTAGAGQKDLLVAITEGATKEVRTLIAFKHALTQIVFKAGNINPSKIDVQIGAVEIVNVASQGDMTFLKSPNNQIKWDIAPYTQDKSYRVMGVSVDKTSGVDVAVVKDNVVGTNKEFKVPSIAAGEENLYAKYQRIQSANETDNNALILMPQHFEQWNPTSGSAKATGQTKAYIKLTALITKAGLTPGETDATKYIYAGGINGTKDAFTYGEVFIPVESVLSQTGEWIPGKRINYIITFGDNNSGSGGGGYDDNGDPILVPIRFRAVVEDWVEVDVPLLTATFEASSDAIKHAFIDGYTNQLLSDVSAAVAPKVFQSSIKIKGKVSNEIGNGTPDPSTTNTAAVVNFRKLIAGAGTEFNSKFRPGSTLEYDFTDIADWNGKTIDVLVPHGWEARSYLDTKAKPVNPASDATAANGATATVKLAGDNGTDDNNKANKIILTKIPTTGYNYQTLVNYIEDNVAAVELNENHLTTAPAAFNTTITVTSGKLTKNLFYSSDMLANFTADGFKTSTVTVNVQAGVSFGTFAIKTICPVGWYATATGTTGNLLPGDEISLSDAGSIVYTKGDGIVGGGDWKGSDALKAWLAAAKGTANNKFYYNNVDGLISTDFNDVVWTTTTLAGTMTGINSIEVYFRYPVGTVKEAGANGAANNWRWDVTNSKATFSKDNATAAPATYTYLTSETQLKTALIGGVTKDMKYVVNMNAPANFTGATWGPVAGLTTAGDEITVQFQGTAGAADITTAPNGWKYDKTSNTATFTAAFAATLDLTTATAGQVFYAQNAQATVATLGAVNTALTNGDKVYVVIDVPTAVTNLPTGWAQVGNVLTYTKVVLTAAELSTILKSGLKNGTNLFVSGAVPADFNGKDWIVTGLAATNTITVNYGTAATVLVSGNGWSMSAGSKAATFTMPAFTTTIVGISTAAANQVFYLDAVGTATVNVTNLQAMATTLDADNTLNSGDEVYVVLKSDIAISVPTSWTKSGLILTYTK